jgi:Mg2+ and Co2+ transporter CorA
MTYFVISYNTKRIYISKQNNPIIHVSNIYEETVDKLITDVSKINHNFEKDTIVPSYKEQLPRLNSKVIDSVSKAKDIRDKLNEIVNWDDEELEDFHIETSELSDKKYYMKRKIAGKQIETLLDNYKSHFEDYHDNLKRMEQKLDLSLKKLDMYYADKRNQIATFNTNLDIITMAIGIANLVSSTYGMNLKNHFETDSKAFFVVVGSMIGLAMIIMVIILKKFNQIHR